MNCVKGGRERCAGGVQRHSRRQEHCSQGEQARPHRGHDLQVLGSIASVMDLDLAF